MASRGIKYYALFENSTEQGAKTQRYTIYRSLGQYPQMDELRGRDGLISMYLIEQIDKEKKSATKTRLQAKGALNFTGLKELQIKDGTAYAYGYPNKAQELKNGNTNPFYNCKNDGYLFIFHPKTDRKELSIPQQIEMIVIENIGTMINQAFEDLKRGKLNKLIDTYRKAIKFIPQDATY